jgi:hypothetical protein
MEGKTWIWVALGAVVLLFLMMRGGNSGVVQLQAPDTSGEVAARFSFAESGLSALASAFSDKVTSQAQLEAERSRDATYLESARIFGDTERFRISSQEKTSLAQYQTALKARQEEIAGSLEETRAEHRWDWTKAVGGVISAIASIF